MGQNFKNELDAITEGDLSMDPRAKPGVPLMESRHLCTSHETNPIPQGYPGADIAELSNQLRSLENDLKKIGCLFARQTIAIGLPSLQGTTFIPIHDILYCKGASSQSSLHLLNKQIIHVNRTLKECQSVLEKYGFCRIHKSYLINVSRINEIKKGEAKGLIMQDGAKLEISPQYKEVLFSLLLQL